MWRIHLADKDGKAGYLIAATSALAAATKALKQRYPEKDLPNSVSIEIEEAKEGLLVEQPEVQPADDFIN